MRNVTVSPGLLKPQLDQEVARQAAMQPVKEVPAALVEALRTEMRALIDGDITKTVGQLIKVATKAQELFIMIRGESLELDRRTRVYGGIGYADSTMGPMMVSPGYNNPEQFGAKAIRELVSLLPEILNAQKNKPETTTELLIAMKVAKDNGDLDIAEALRAKIMGAPAKESETKEIVTTRAEIVIEAHEKPNGNGTNGIAHDCDAHGGA